MKCQTKIGFYLKAMLMLLLLMSQEINVFSQDKKAQLHEPIVIQPVLRGSAPSDAVVLFKKGSLNNFESIKDGAPAAWKVRGKKFTVATETTAIQTKEKFGDCQLHIEWRTPVKDVKAGKVGQASGNSGIFLMSKYEVQVLNSYINKTYTNGQAGAIYGRHVPLVNASLKPGKWQTYDIIFTAPRFKSDGSAEKPGYFTVIHNGVLIQNHVEISGATPAGNKKMPNLSELPIMLQNHKSEVSYRNIWIRRL
jgi:hypothetical protein